MNGVTAQCAHSLIDSGHLHGVTAVNCILTHRLRSPGEEVAVDSMVQAREYVAGLVQHEDQWQCPSLRAASGSVGASPEYH